MATVRIVDGCPVEMGEQHLLVAGPEPVFGQPSSAATEAAAEEFRHNPARGRGRRRYLRALRAAERELRPAAESTLLRRADGGDRREARTPIILPESVCADPAEAATAPPAAAAPLVPNTLAPADAPMRLSAG